MSSDYTEIMNRRIAEAVQRDSRKIVVLDDDPTGTQTVQGVDILTVWDEERLTEAFLDSRPLFYILTNSRGFDAAGAETINREIAAGLLKVSERTDTPFTVISRGDSTLRGHYPLEIEVLADRMSDAGPIDAHLLIPAFFEAGRITRGDTHYLLVDGKPVPVHETEFAGDTVFGYRHSVLTDWIEEKTNGRIQAEDVISLSLEHIREGGPEAVYRLLTGLEGNVPVVVNAENYTDLQIAALGMIQAEQSGKRLLYRTSASFVKVRGAIADQSLLGAADLVNKTSERSGGVIFVGSHVKVTTGQLEQLLTLDGLAAHEFDVGKLLDPEERDRELRRVITGMNRDLASGTDVVVYTSRKLIRSDGRKEANLQISRQVSSAFIQLVRALERKPRYMIAKGGITSSDIATDGLGIRKAAVLGQIAQGVPVWQCGPETLFPGLAYVVFPGNVGQRGTLRDIVLRCRGDLK